MYEMNQPAIDAFEDMFIAYELVKNKSGWSEKEKLMMTFGHYIEGRDLRDKDITAALEHEREEVYRRDCDLEGANERIEQLEAALSKAARRGGVAGEVLGSAGDSEPKQAEPHVLDYCKHGISIFKPCEVCRQCAERNGAKADNSDRLFNMPETVEGTSNDL